MMRSEINVSRHQLEQMTVKGVQLDDAEIQWNVGLNLNIDTMKASENLLAIYGKYPPKYKKCQ